ncbi:general transcription factor II-I repeat domain-containing protein 2A [Trichonephila clavipes]|nr:general transcription factor II-I repeat domain-containing protein 2A [Trichonephila clavipes]
MFKYVNKNCHTSVASYSAANARHGKPFQEGEFLKEAWLACAHSLFDDFENKDKVIQRIKDVPLSRNTMKDRILNLAENVTDQQKNDINSAPFISLCFDESIDITKSASLLTTTKGTDICTAVRNSLAEKEIDSKKIVSVLID